MIQKLRNIFYLGVKELQGLLRDPLMVCLILYTFSLGIYVAAKAAPETLSKATIAVVDEDKSQMSKRMTNALLPPYFKEPVQVSRSEIDNLMDQGKCTFALVIPYNFQRDILAGNKPELQLNVDATRMSQAFSGGGYIQNILLQEIAAYNQTENITPPARIVTRNRFNPNLTQSWFKAIMQLINNVTMLAIILTGAALIREREHGTLEHLLVMPVTEFEIMTSKIWSMALVVMFAAGASLLFVIQGIMQVPVAGSFWLFMTGLLLHLFAVTSMGIFLACIAQNMPQIGMLLILVLMPMQMLSGGSTPMESMPGWVQFVMQAAPTTHFVQLSQAILYRGAGIEVVWKQFAALIIIGSVLFVFSWSRFKKSLAS